MLRWDSQTLTRWAKYGLACAAFLFLAESRLLAGCGDHQLFNFQAFETVSTSTPHAIQPGAGLTTSNLNKPLPCGQCPFQQNMPGEEPCRGPYCSGNPLPHGTPVSSTNVQETQELWSLCNSLGTPDCQQHGNWLHPSESILPISSTDSIFHPPRQA
jgi:hypothetical protein